MSAPSDQDEARTTTSLPGVVVPPPQGLRECLELLGRFAKGEPIESFLSAMLKRLQFDAGEKLELSAGLPELLALSADPPLIEQTEGRSKPALGSLALGVVVLGVHQLLYHQPRPGGVPAEVSANIAALRSLEALLSTQAPSTSGREYLHRYRHSLGRRGLIELSAEERSRATSLVDRPSLPRTASPSSTRREASSRPRQPSARTPPKPRPNKQAAGRQTRWLLFLLLVALGVGGWFFSRDEEPALSTPSSIRELPVISMTRYVDSVAVRVDPSWLEQPLPQRVEGAEALFARFHRESNGEVLRLTVQDSASKVLGSVDADGASFH